MLIRILLPSFATIATLRPSLAPHCRRRVTCSLLIIVVFTDVRPCPWLSRRSRLHVVGDDGSKLVVHSVAVTPRLPPLSPSHLRCSLGGRGASGGPMNGQRDLNVPVALRPQLPTLLAQFQARPACIT